MLRGVRFFCARFGWVAFLATAFAHAADPVVVALPCDRAPFDSCDVLKKRLLDGADPAKPGGLHGWVKEMIEDAYAGKSRVAQGGASCETVAPVGKPPLCPPLKVGENGCADEYSQNAKGEACPALSRVGYVTDSQFYSNLGKQTAGSRETATLSGGVILAISDSAAELEREIGLNQVAIPASSPCYAQARQLLRMLRDQTQPDILAEIAQCSPNMSVCSAKKYFDSTMVSLESAYHMVMRCQLSEEAAKKFRDFVDQYPTRIHDDVVRICGARANGNAAAMQSCYATEYAGWIKARAKTMFPGAAARCAN